MKTKLIISLIITGCALLISWTIYAQIQHDKKYKCIKGHTEIHLQYSYGSDGMITGTYPVEMFVCDCEILRDSLQK